MIDPSAAYRVLGRSLMQIGDVIRGADPNKPDLTRPRNQRFVRRVFEGVLLEDLASAASLDAPEKAQFRIKSKVRGADTIDSDGTLEVWSRARYASFRSGDYGLAFEMYPNVFYWMPMDCANPLSSSSSMI